MAGAAHLVPVFRYADVPDEHHDWLRRRADDITSTAYRVVCDYVRIGQILAEVAERLRRRRLFRAWVEAYCPFGRQYAYKLMQIAAAFAPHVRPDADEVIDAKALVILAAAPAEVVAYAVEQAGEGRRVNARAAREMIAEYRRRVTPSPEEARKFRATVAELDADERQAAERRVAELEPQARAWGGLLRLVGVGGVVTVTTVDDTDCGEGPPPYHVVALLPAGRKEATRRFLADAVAAVLGEETTRTCPGCNTEKPLAEFGENESKAGGKNSRCKPCEYARVRTYKREKRAAARAERDALKSSA